MNEQELKDAISDMQECRELIGKANMKLNNILTQRKADMQKKLDDAYDRGYKKCLSEHEFDMPCSICDDYERGLNDAWSAAKKINMEAVHGGYNTKTLEKVFGTPSNCTIMRKFSVKEAIQKINEYECEIRVGDEVQFGSFTFVVTAYNKETGLLSGFDHKGNTHAGIVASRVKKTGRGIDMVSLLEGLRE